MHHSRRPSAPLMRGGLARPMAPPPFAEAPSLPPPPVAVRGPAGPAPTIGNLWGDLTRGVEWSPVYLGFLVYILTITTYAVPLGDVAIGVATFGLLFQRQRFVFPPIAGFMVAFIAWALVGIVHSTHPMAVWDASYLMLKLLVIVVVAANAIRTPAQLRFFLVFWLACFALYPLRGSFFNYFLYHNTRLGRAQWKLAFGNPNDLSAMTILQISMAVGLLAIERQRLLRWAAIIGVFMLTLLVFMAQSRGALIALAVFAGATLAGARRGKRLRAFLLLGAVGATVAMFAPSAVWERIGGLAKIGQSANLRDVDKEGSAEQRLEIWKVAVAIIADQPFLGVGLGAYQSAHDRMSRRSQFKPTAWGPRDTHSTLLNVAAETGLPGVAIFIALIAQTLMFAAKARRKLTFRSPGDTVLLRSLQLGFVAFLIAGIWGSLASVSFLYIHGVLIWIVAAVMSRPPGTPAAQAR
jgi:O-antigen ligase